MTNTVQLQRRALAALCAGLLIGGQSLAATTDDMPSLKPPGAKITEEKAKEIALKVVPGEVTGVTVEKKKGKQVFVVEIMSKTKGEKDVFVDIVTGKVIGID